MNPSIAIIVVNYGSHDLLARNFADAPWLESDAQLFVVDNFTSGAELTSLSELAHNQGWRVVESPTNVGFGAGVDLGVAAAIERGHELLLLINPDVAMTSGVLSALRDQIASDPMVMVSPRIVTPSGKLWFDGGLVDLDSGRVRTAAGADMRAPFAWLSGACLALSSTLWRRAGGFDAEYFLYWEDVDFSQRVVRAGGTLLVRNDLQVVHDVGGTQGVGKSAVYLRFNTRNRLLFAAKWLPRETVRKWIRHTPIESYRVLVRGGRRSLLRWPMVSAAMAGSAQGLRAARSRGPRPRPALAGARDE